MNTRYLWTSAALDRFMREGQCLRGDESYTAWYENPVASGKQQILPYWQGEKRDTLHCDACLPNIL